MIGDNILTLSLSGHIAPNTLQKQSLPFVLLNGPRQTGKSALVQKLPLTSNQFNIQSIQHPINSTSNQFNIHYGSI